MSHAERGKTFWIREFLAGMRLCRRFAPTPFRALIPISNFGGGGEIRTHGTLSGTAVFKTATLNHGGLRPPKSATADKGGRHRSRTLRNQAVEGFLGGLGRRAN